MRGVGKILHRVSIGVHVRLPAAISISIGGRFRVSDRTGLASLSSYSFQSNVVGVLLLPYKVKGREPNDAVRRISNFPVVCMGRRSCKIAGRKEAQNAKKMKLYCKIGKEVVSAVKKGGASLSCNMALAALLEKANELDVPKEMLDRNIKRASEKGQEAFIEKVYEVYGFGGVSMVVEVLTDKITRSVAAVRSVVRDCGAKMADPGSVLFKFKRVRVVNIKASDVDKDQLLSVALDAGAEDVIEPPTYEDDADADEDTPESYYKVISSSEDYGTILSMLRDEGINFETDGGSELLPIMPVEVDDEAADLNKEIVSKLLELDDVDAVYTDQK